MVAKSTKFTPVVEDKTTDLKFIKPMTICFSLTRKEEKRRPPIFLLWPTNCHKFVGSHGKDERLTEFEDRCYNYVRSFRQKPRSL